MGREVEAPLFDARLVDSSLYACETLVGEESDGVRVAARWIPLGAFAPGGLRLVPDGLYALLRDALPHAS